jgi:BirA family transcriptional regulator, biotin operon repressor / biotin---[acetyl-CoA-carboxylase] ligase
LPLFNNRIGQPLVQLQSIDSTNNYAIEKLHAGMAQHGMAVLAGVQTQGRGQRAKSWQSEPGMNLLCSMVLESAGLPLQQAFVFSMAMALAARAVFNKYAGNETTIKWPNDIMWRDRKAGGILIENVVQGQQWKFAVVGVGMNINQTNFEAFSRKAVSLKQITGKAYSIPAIAQDLFGQVEAGYASLLQDPGGVIARYHENLYRIHQTVRLKNGSRIFPALIKGVAPDGSLITGQDIEEHFAVGEVEWVD